MSLYSVAQKLVGRAGEKGALNAEQRKRLMIAKELITEPVVLALDDPFEGLDFRGIKTVCQCLRRVSDNGKLVVVGVSNSVLKDTEILEVFDQLLLLDKGRKVFDESIFS
jgi:ABC-type multidrug transport system ATPase subunit